MALLLSYGCARQPESTMETTSPTTGKNQTGLVYQGKIVAQSKRARTLSLKTGRGEGAKTILIKYDAGTKGIEYAAKGHTAVIVCKIQNGELRATVIKPKTAKLPPGITGIQTDELKALLDDNEDMILVDTCPRQQYSAAHISGAVHLPASDYTERAASVLPEDKEQLLIFYCAGST